VWVESKKGGVKKLVKEGAKGEYVLSIQNQGKKKSLTKKNQKNIETP